MIVIFFKLKQKLMKNNKDYPDMPGPAESQPRVSLILPFELKMNHEKGLFDLLTKSADKIEKELRTSFSEERTRPVIKKLRHMITGIHCQPNNQSIAIFVSPLTEKVYFFTGTRELTNNFPLL
jgi:hypothetical protein